MRAEVLARYQQDASGRALIDVAANCVEDLYNHFDRNAPYIRRDLDQELTDYLIDSATELESKGFSIQFSFKQGMDQSDQARISHSINQYFNYLEDTEHFQFKRMVHKSMLLLVLGLLILSFAVWANQLPGQERTVINEVFAQGLTVAAWVSLWEALATLLIEWFPHRKKVYIYRSLANAPLKFESGEIEA